MIIQTAIELNRKLSSCAFLTNRVLVSSWVSRKERVDFVVETEFHWLLKVYRTTKIFVDGFRVSQNLTTVSGHQEMHPWTFWMKLEYRWRLIRTLYSSNTLVHLGSRPTCQGNTTATVQASQLSQRGPVYQAWKSTAPWWSENCSMMNICLQFD